MSNRTFILPVMIVSILISTTTFSQEKSVSKVHGYFFGDYFYKLGGTDVQITASQYSKTPKHFQAFQFRRLYLYYDHTFSEKFTSQFLLEGNDKAIAPDGKHGVFIKTAYLEWKDLSPFSSLLFGLVPTPTWSLIPEKVWNYRSIEKTIVDYRGLGAASDIGVQVRGKIDAEGKFNYVAMIGNGTGQQPENNKQKKYYFSFNAKPIKELTVEAYLDHEPAALSKDKSTYKGFAAYQASNFTVGLEVFQQKQRKAGTGGTSKVPFGLSLFGWAPIPGVDGLNAYVRYDMFDPDTRVDTTGFKETFIVLGVDYMPISNVHIMPNVWVNSYSAKGAGSRDTDVVARLSFFVVYK